MAPDGLLTLVLDGTGLQNRFDDAEDILDRPECLADVSYRLGVVNVVGVPADFLLHHSITPLPCLLAPCLLGSLASSLLGFEHEHRHIDVMANIIRGAAVEQVADETVAMSGHGHQVTATTFDPADDLIRGFTVSQFRFDLDARCRQP